MNFDWNNIYPANHPRRVTSVIVEPTLQQMKNVTIVSECLRDGLHGSPILPNLNDIFAYIECLVELGINKLVVGVYNGKDGKINEIIVKVLKFLHSEYPNVTPVVLSLTSDESIDWVAECSGLNSKIEAIVFRGTSLKRIEVEQWDINQICDDVGEATTKLASKYGVRVVGATEHTTQTHPDILKKVIKTFVENGAMGFCVADTAGIARPAGVHHLIRFVRDQLDKTKNPIDLHWHGHRDLGNSLINSMVAMSNGADHIHVVARGAGERAGNTPLESVILNLDHMLSDMKITSRWNLAVLGELLQMYDTMRLVDSPIYGVMGTRAFTTSLGIHSSAMLKVLKQSENYTEFTELSIHDLLSELGKDLYTSIEPAKVGRQHDVKISPWSGESSVKLYWLLLGRDLKKLSKSEVCKILELAKTVGRELSLEEIDDLLGV